MEVEYLDEDEEVKDDLDKENTFSSEGGTEKVISAKLTEPLDHFANNFEHFRIQWEIFQSAYPSSYNYFQNNVQCEDLLALIKNNPIQNLVKYLSEKILEITGSDYVPRNIIVKICSIAAEKFP